MFILKNNETPCHGCTDREVGCHGSCERYKEFRTNLDKENEERYKRSELNVKLNEIDSRRLHNMPKLRRNGRK